MEPNAGLDSALVVVVCHMGMAAIIAVSAFANSVGWW